MMRNTKLEGHIRGKRITDKSWARTPVLRKENNISSKYLHQVCGNKQKMSHTSLYHLQLALTPNCHQVSTYLPINIQAFLTHTKKIWKFYFDSLQLPYQSDVVSPQIIIPYWFSLG